MTRRPTFVAAALWILTASSAGAEGPKVVVGSRVRVTLPSAGPRLVGVVSAIDDTQMTILAAEGGAMAVSRADVTRVELSFGRRSNVQKGFLIGALAGLLMQPAFCHLCTSGETAEAALEGLTIYGLVGAGVGALVKSERWLDVSVKPSTTGPSVSITLRF